jgi:hypothetical protein
MESEFQGYHWPADRAIDLTVDLHSAVQNPDYTFSPDNLEDEVGPAGEIAPPAPPFSGACPDVLGQGLLSGFAPNESQCFLMLRAIHEYTMKWCTDFRFESGGNMTEPMDVILAFHNAFRTDMATIDAAALGAAAGTAGLEAQLQRYRFFNEMLVWHADGEEAGIFPAVETVAPLVAEAYERDHRGLDAAFDALNAAVAAGNALETARASAAFKFHLNMHLGKEDAHLYRIVRERISLPDQGQALGIVASKVPQERFPEVIAWLFPLINDTDRENTTRIWQMVMPAPVFEGMKGLIRQALGRDWDELTRRIPTLN